MKISEKFKHFTMEWDLENPDNILVDAYDVSYDMDVQKLISFANEICLKRQSIKTEKAL